MSSKYNSYLELVEACDNFPFIDIGKTPYNESPDHVFYEFRLPDDDRAHGFMHPSVVTKMPWTDDFVVSTPDQRPRTVTLVDSSHGADTAAACNAALARLVHAARDAQVFAALSSRPLREDFRILGAKYPSVPPAVSQVQLSRPAASLFGIACRGAHMTVYTRTRTGDIKIWVPRRSAHLKTWPGKLDNSVAGGVRAEESPFECIVHEADEEASIPGDLVRRDAVACGAVTYVSESGAGSGGEFGLMVPDVLYVYDLEVGPEVVLKPQDDEVEAFYLWDVDQVREALLRGDFKTNCAPVMIDFFVRHGIITEDNDPDFLDIVTRLHRKLPVPTSTT